MKQIAIYGFGLTLTFPVAYSRYKKEKILLNIGEPVSKNKKIINLIKR